MINKFSKVAKNTLYRHSQVISIRKVYRENIGMSVYKMSLLRIVNRISSMLMMFIPIKVFILISSDTVLFSNLYDMKSLGYDLTLTILFCFLFFVFIASIGSQFFFSKATSDEIKKIRGVKEFFYDGKVYSRIFISRNYIPVINFLSDLFIILISFAIYAFCSIEFAIFQAIFVMVLYMVYDYVLFTNNRLKILSKISLTPIEFVAFSSQLVLLVGFMFVFIIYLQGNINVSSGVLILMVTRMLSGSMRGYSNSMIKIESNIRGLDPTSNT
ncbi:TPA: hypothetical protein KD862_002834 [Vibrio cholerae]|uniref:hypothetical protein n=1 Tax=Vibrio TaxID=662 RepID=UPI000DE54461|nr:MULTISPECIES: hypothetical protein [Vibrio]TXY86711.1 hypothetical protein FXE75_02610 [Vibrio cholerae]BCN20863.1 hypothetical protein [Vibrio cholerae]BCN22087.1 hypothetical protein [Vibrio cholerae]GHW38897.1 hypothetical protein VCSRO56_2091 [Vibrio cholerae]GIB85782.1 hypothetical protein VCSRO95_1473 [Vibrio cholerae]